MSLYMYMYNIDILIHMYNIYIYICIYSAYLYTHILHPGLGICVCVYIYGIYVCTYIPSPDVDAFFTMSHGEHKNLENFNSNPTSSFTLKGEKIRLRKSSTLLC